MKGTCEQIPFHFFLKFMMLNYGGGLAYNKEAFVNMAKVGTSWEYAGIWADINDTLTSEFNAYITGATDIDTALDNLQKKGEAVIEAAKS